MSGEVINLRRVRKTKDRLEKAAAAADNRVKFGRSAVEKEALAIAEAKAVRHLDNHRLTTSGDRDD